MFSRCFGAHGWRLQNSACEAEAFARNAERFAATPFDNEGIDMAMGAFCLLVYYRIS